MLRVASIFIDTIISERILRIQESPNCLHTNILKV